MGLDKAKQGAQRQAQGTRRPPSKQGQALLTQKELLTIFDGLPPVKLEQMQGFWRGKELRAGHPLEGLLETCGWFGKNFASPNCVHPLVFKHKKRFYANPSLMPLWPSLATLPPKLLATLFAATRPFITTRRPQASLRMIEFRGISSAAMVYDKRPIIDYFRALDDNTLLGIMDLKGDRSKKLFFFILVRGT